MMQQLNSVNGDRGQWETKSRTKTLKQQAALERAWCRLTGLHQTEEATSAAVCCLFATQSLSGSMQCAPVALHCSAVSMSLRPEHTYTIWLRAKEVFIIKQYLLSTGYTRQICHAYSRASRAFGQTINCSTRLAVKVTLRSLW